MSNAERQERFRRAHPGYNRKYKRKEDHGAALKAIAEVYERVLAQEREQERARVESHKQPLALPAPPQRLMLTAPIEMPVVRGMNTVEVRVRRLAPLEALSAAAMK